NANHLLLRMQGIRAAGTYKVERVITSPMRAQLKVANTPVCLALCCLVLRQGPLAGAELFRQQLLWPQRERGPHQGGKTGVAKRSVCMCGACLLSKPCVCRVCADIGHTWLRSEFGAVHLRHTGHSQATGKESSR